MSESEQPTTETVTCTDGDEPRTFDVIVPLGMKREDVKLCAGCPYSRMCFKKK